MVKKMVWKIPLATVGQFMNKQLVKVGFWNHYTDSFDEDCPKYEGSMGGLMFDKPNRELWTDLKMREVNHIGAEDGYVIIGVDRYR